MADIGACSPVVGAARGALGVLRLAVGARVLVARCACSMAVLFPSFWTVIQHGCWVRLLIGSLTLCGWGSIPLLSAGVHAPVCLGFPRLCSGGRGVGFSLFLVWTVFAWLSRRVGGCSLWGCSGISRLSTVWPLPVLLRAGRERAIPCLGMVWFPCVVVLGRRR